MAWLTLFSTAGVLLGTSLAYLVYILYDYRRKINELRQQGVPMPKEWSWVTGHLLVLQKYIDKIPPSAAVAFAMRDLSQEFADTEIFLMDVWPVYPALFTLFGPETITEVCNKHNLPKTTVADSCFSTGAMLNNVPHVVDSALVFREKLVENIGKGMFSLDELTTNLAMEVILKVTLKPKEIKSVTSLALEAYLEERQTKEGAPSKDVLDERFVTYATSQIRLFLFAGTDTSSSMMVYIYHMLAKNPDWLRQLRNEHDEIFGRDPAEAASLLKETPSLLNSCKLTLAFIKETLRLYAPAGTMRAGIPGMTVTDLQGIEQPIQYAGVNVLHQALHINPRVWTRPTEFLPERFLVAPGHELYPDPTAFRPFEQGPRNCIGQTLVWNELRIVIILTCRDLEIRDAYDDFDAMKEHQMSAWGRWKTSLFGQPIKTVHGDRAYQTDSGGLHPVDGYPCYVKWTSDDSFVS
ncbi:hypothetical protein NPX13_g1693 [Xylaria arbuscula]|uniref:Cytochrome P450 n=1 Tax=Xylaria arbuscula TaxID=114810 RepID=A0A9W8NLZ7_9PEZI|nr:hypothetical protein NPX13_g1693 [Xylaria arbuscula]